MMQLNTLVCSIVITSALTNDLCLQTSCEKTRLVRREKKASNGSNEIQKRAKKLVLTETPKVQKSVQA